MACNKYCNCTHCAKDDNCPLDHYGDGTPFCRGFQCNEVKCERTECISYEEEMEVFRQ